MEGFSAGVLVDLFIRNLQVGKIIKFPLEINNENFGDHFHIIVAIDCDVVYMVCCQSNKTTMDRLIKRFGYDNATVPYINHKNGANDLTKDTYVDCNRIFDIEIESLKNLVINQQIKSSGNVAEGDFEQIKNGIIISKLADLPEEFMIYPSKFV